MESLHCVEGAKLRMDYRFPNCLCTIHDGSEIAYPPEKWNRWNNSKWWCWNFDKKISKPFQLLKNNQKNTHVNSIKIETFTILCCKVQIGRCNKYIKFFSHQNLFFSKYYVSIYSYLFENLVINPHYLKKNC